MLIGNLASPIAGTTPVCTDMGFLVMSKQFVYMQLADAAASRRDARQTENAEFNLELTSLKAPMLPYADGMLPRNWLLDTFSALSAGNMLTLTGRVPLQSARDGHISTNLVSGCLQTGMKTGCL